MKTTMWTLAAVLAFGAVSTLSGCKTSGSEAAANTGVTATMTQAEQKAMTPDQALARLMAGNNRFVAGTSMHRNYIAQAKATSSGQFPFAVVHTCIDSRSAPEVVFDQGLGDLFVPRIAGNYVQGDILGSMEFATKVAGARLVMVVGHTACGAVMGAADNVELGNLTTVIKEIRPAVEQVQNVPGDRTSANQAFVFAATEMNVRMTVAKIRRDSSILRGLEDSGQIKIVGAMHDLATGKVTILN